MADFEARSQLFKLLDNHVAVTHGVVSLEAEQTSWVVAKAFGKLDERRARPIVQMCSIHGGSPLYVACPIALAVGLRIPERLDVDIENFSLAESIAERSLREASAPRERQLTHIDQALDASGAQLV
jgi:hypothetical protein